MRDLGKRSCKSQGRVELLYIGVVSDCMVMSRVKESPLDLLIKCSCERLRKNPCKSLQRVEMLSIGVAWITWS